MAGAAITGALASAGMARSLSMAEIASAPFPAFLTAAPKGESVAWMFNERGARNIWVGSLDAAGKAHSRRITAYTGDDGVDISALAWTGDGASLVYVRGGDSGGRRPINPGSLASGPVPGSIYAVPAAGGAPRVLAEGTDPSPAPKGDMIMKSMMMVNCRKARTAITKIW